MSSPDKPKNKAVTKKKGSNKSTIKKPTAKKSTVKKATTKKSATKKPTTKKPQSKRASTGSASKSPKPKKKTPAKRKKSSKGGSAKKANPRFFSLSRIFKVLVVLLVIALVGVIYTDANVRSKFEGKRWSIPAKVYAQPLELYPGKSLTQAQLVSELARLKYQKVRLSVSDSESVSTSERVGSFTVQNERHVQISTRGFQFWDGMEKAKRMSVRFHEGRVERIVEDLQGDYRSLPLVRLEPVLIGGIYPRHNEDRELIRLDQVPEELINTLIAVEDREYARHNGVSIKGIARALLVNVSSGKIKQGGSTLTQQLVKNFYLTSKRSISRKAMEALMALLLELHYSKGEILEAYLNEVYVGQSGAKAIHGFGLASQFYFGQPIQELKLHQSALLIGLIKGPSYYDPRRHPKRAIKRRNQVVDVLLELNQITSAHAKTVKQAPLGVVGTAAAHSKTYPAFMDLLKRQLRRDYRDEDLNSEGLRIFTTLDPMIQHQSELALSQTIKGLQKRDYGMGGELEGAMVITEPENGEILAIVGGKKPRFAGFNRALDAVRPVGSVIKPAVYLAALEKGLHFAQFVEDESIKVTTENGEIWQPKNFGKKGHGQILMQEGLINSYNLATTKIGLKVGIESVIDVLERGGIKRALPKVPSLFLGAAELSPLDVTAFYQTIAANGFTTPLRTIREITTSDGEPLVRYPLAVQQSFDSADVYIITRAMQMVAERGTAKRIYQRLSTELKAAGKTGTTNNLRDSWFVGITGNYLGVAWVGRDDNGPTRLTGSTGAMAAWTELMTKIQPEPLTPLQPENVLDVWISPIQES